MESPISWLRRAFIPVIVVAFVAGVLQVGVNIGAVAESRTDLRGMGQS